MSTGVIYRVGGGVMALLFITVVIGVVGVSPVEVMASLWRGAFGTPDRLARVLATWAPLVLCGSGLIFSFAAGAYNLGVEGQIMVGAIGTTFLLRLLEGSLPGGWVIGFGILGGAMAGGLWGVLAGVLNVYGRINEIFAGLGLNFVAQGWALYLIFGPWKRQGIASMSGTQLFEESLWLPTWGETEASPIAWVLAAIALVITIGVMRGTYFGLQLRAVGRNPQAATILGIPAQGRVLSAFWICGLGAGIAGALQVVAVFHRLIPNISSNLGFLGLLVVMLIGFDPLWILPVAFFFSALNIGSLQLPLALQVESSLAGVIQGTLVLFTLLAQGIARRRSGQIS